MTDFGKEWQLAGRRKDAARKSKTRKRSPPSARCQEEDLDIEKTVKRIKDTTSELGCEEFWQKWKEQILVASSFSGFFEGERTDHSFEEPERCQEGRPCQQLECVCYGLGSFSSCPSARFQLAMLLLLLDARQIPLKNCLVFDPIFSNGEKMVLKKLGLNVLSENEEGKRLATKPTIFYLMHCGKALYNNILWKNWSTKCLSLIMIIGNGFTGMKDRSIDREFQRDYSYMNQALDVCEEKQLPCPTRFIDVFGDTATITFPLGNLSKLPQSTWVEPQEPEYQHCPDLEIILKKSQM